MMSEFDNDNQEKPSKTQRKKNMQALQDLGETLVDLPRSQLDKIELPEDLLEAVLFARTLKTRESKRRQLQYIGKIMREVDPEPIQAALKRIDANNRENAYQFQQIEQWREQLISDGDAALQKLLEIYPQADRQTLRQLMRNAQRDRAHNKKTGVETELFRCLRELLQK